MKTRAFRGSALAPALFLLTMLMCGCSGSAERFDGGRAFVNLKAQVDCGPRVPGSEGHSKCLDLIVSYLEKQTKHVKVSRFSQKVDGKILEMANISAVINPEASEWVLLCAHWDTRPIADMEIDPKLKNKPIPGANDGASGVAVLMELSRIFAKTTPKIGVLFVFFDGEDYGRTDATMFFGSRYFAKNINATSIPAWREDVRIRYGILLDMVGDKDLRIYRERNSQDAAPKIVDKIWRTASRMGYAEHFVDEVKYQISDDHLPLIAAGIKCVDIIDFDYGPWHTLDDTVDKCSAGSLEIVGRVVSSVVYSEKK